MLCTCHNQFKFDERGSLPESKVENDASRELFAKAKERESKLSESSFEGAQASLQEAPTTNNEVLSSISLPLMSICHRLYAPWSRGHSSLLCIQRETPNQIESGVPFLSLSI